MAHDYDNVIVIDGYEGTGKSTLALHLAARIDPSFTVNNVVYNHGDWDAIFDHRAKGKVYVLDEGGDLGFNRDWNKAPNKKLMQKLMQARYTNSTFIFCIPNMRWLDMYLREHRTSWRFHVHGRGKATLQVKSGNWRSGKTWYKDVIHDIRYPSLEATKPGLWRSYLTRAKGAKDEAMSGNLNGSTRKRSVTVEKPPRLASVILPEEP